MNLYEKAWNIIRRGRVSAPPDDSGIAQKIQVTKSFGETASHESWSHYGFSSVPLVGCDTAMVSGDGGNQSKGLIIATNDVRHKPTSLNAGAVCLYESTTQRILLDPTTMKITINGASEIDIEIAGALIGQFTSAGLHVTGTITASVDVIANGVSLKNHLTSDVQSGSGVSGPPIG